MPVEALSESRYLFQRLSPRLNSNIFVRDIMAHDGDRLEGCSDVDLSENGRQLEEAMNDLETSKTNAERADDIKDRLILKKMEEDDAKTKAQQEMMTYVKMQEKCKEEFSQSMNAVQNEFLQLGKHKRDLQEDLKRRLFELEAKKAKLANLAKRFKIHIEIPHTKVNFRSQNKEERIDNSQLIRGMFAISQRPSMLLQGQHALITFEEKKVASQILKISKCPVSCGNGRLVVKPKKVTMDPAVKFEVHLDTHRRKLKVSNVHSSMPEERIKDRLEMSFSRPSRGGGEVESLKYTKNLGTGQITFLHPGVSEDLALRGTYFVDLESEVNAEVGPVYKHHLRKFQTFSCSPERTIVLGDIEDIEDVEDLQDLLEIHFQKPSNCGGEIEHIKYMPRGQALQAIFLCQEMEMDYLE